MEWKSTDRLFCTKYSVKPRWKVVKCSISALLQWNTERKDQSLPYIQPKAHILINWLLAGETDPHDTVQLTHGSRGICSLPSSPGGSDQATPLQRDDHQGGGTPSPSGINTHKLHHMNTDEIPRSHTETGYVYGSLEKHGTYKHHFSLSAEWFCILFWIRSQPTPDYA